MKFTSPTSIQGEFCKDRSSEVQQWISKDNSKIRDIKNSFVAIKLNKLVKLKFGIYFIKSLIQIPFERKYLKKITRKAQDLIKLDIKKKQSNSIRQLFRGHVSIQTLDKRQIRLC